MEQKSTDILPKYLRMDLEMIQRIESKGEENVILMYHKALESAEKEIESLKTLLEESEKEKDDLKSRLKIVNDSSNKIMDILNNLD